MAGLLSLLTACFIPGEDMTFYQEYEEVSKEVANVLIRHGVCELQFKKCGGYIYFVGPINGGFQFQTYAIEDQEILGEINNIIVKKFDETPQMQHVRIREYRKTHADHGAFEYGDIIFKNDLWRKK